MRNLEKMLNVLCILVLSGLITYMVYLDYKYVTLTHTPELQEILSPYQLAYADCLGETQRYAGFDIREREMSVCLQKRGFETK